MRIQIRRYVRGWYVMRGNVTKYSYLHRDGVWRRSTCLNDDWGHCSDEDFTGYFATFDQALGTLQEVLWVRS